MNKENNIQAQGLLRSTGLNMAGYIIPMIFLFAATPIITSGLGSERYGVLATIWLVVGYFVIFDFGLGAAATRFVAASIGNNRADEIPQLVWTTAVVQLITGIFAGAILSGLTPFLVNDVFKIPPEYTSEAKVALWLGSISLPLTFLSGSLTGIFSAYQRFGIVNITKILNSASIYVSGLLCVYLAKDLSFIIAIFLIARALILLLQLMLAGMLVPSLMRFEFSKYHFKRVAVFAGWIAFSNIINPLMFYIDRFLIGAILSMSALAYYSVSFDLAARVWIISTSLTMVLFPAFSTLIARGDNNSAADYFVRSIKFLVLVSGPLVCVMATYSTAILTVWVGPEFAVHGALALKILLISTLLDYPAIISSTLVEGSGQPRSVAIVKAAYLPIHVVLTYLGLSLLGLAGVALAVLVMRVVYSVFFAGSAMKLLRLRPKYIYKSLAPSYFIILIFLTVSIVLSHLHESLGLRATMVITLMISICYVTAAWFVVLDMAERSFVRRMFKKIPAQ